MAIGAWFGTAYDAPAHVLDLPVEVTSGRDPGIGIVDQVVRGAKIVGRVTGDFGAVALNVRGTGRPVRVAVTVQLDEMGTRWWADRVRPPLTAPELPRLVLLRSQGRLRGATVLARPQGLLRAGSAQATLRFDLTADELAGDGLLVVELAQPTMPSWVTGRVSARSAVGLRIDTITVRTPAGPTADDGPGAHTGCDLAVVPAGTSRDLRLDVVTVPTAPPLPRSPRNRWTRQKPARAGFKVLRTARRATLHAGSRARPARPGGALGVLAADLLTGVPLTVEVVARRPGGLDVRLPEGSPGPVLLGLAEARPGLALRVRPA